MHRRPRRFQATPTNGLPCRPLGITGWTDTGISLADGTRGSQAIGWFRRTREGIGLRRDTPAGASSADTGVAPGGTSIVDLSAVAIVSADPFALRSKPTEHPHHVDRDSEAPIAILGRITGGNANAAANNSSQENTRPFGFDHTGDHLLVGADASGMLARITAPRTKSPFSNRRRREATASCGSGLGTDHALHGECSGALARQTLYGMPTILLGRTAPFRRVGVCLCRWHAYAAARLLGGTSGRTRAIRATS